MFIIIDIMRNSFLISKAFKTFLGAAVLTSLATQICCMSDAIIMSHVISPNAMSAINLCGPIAGLVLSLVPLLCMGSSMRVAVAIGNQNKVEAKQIFTTTLVASMGIALFFGTVMLIFRAKLTEFVCPNEEIYPLAIDYLTMWLIGLPVYMINSMLYSFVSVDGQPALVSKAVITSSIVNIILDLVFAKFLHMGIKGAPLATICGMLFGIGIMCTHLFSKNSSFGLISTRGIFWKDLSASLKRGYTFALNLIICSLGSYLLNNIIINALGTTGIFIWSICAQVTMLSSMAINGAAEALFSIGGVLIGEGDNEGLSRLYKQSQRVMTICVGIFTVIVLCVPSLLGSLFGANTVELKQAAAWPIRFFALSVLPLATIGVARNVYLLLGYSKVVSAMTFVQMGVQIVVLWICSLISGPLIWPGIIISALVTSLIQFIIARHISKGNPYMNRFSLISEMPADPNVHFSVPYDVAKIEQPINDLMLFLDVCELTEETKYNIRLCAEELFMNILDHPRTEHDASFDVHVSEKVDSIVMIVKDCGKPFDPVRTFSDFSLDNLMEEDIDSFRLHAINSSCSSIDYKYMYGQNTTYLKWDKTVGNL